MKGYVGIAGLRLSGNRLQPLRSHVVFCSGCRFCGDSGFYEHSSPCPSNCQILFSVITLRFLGAFYA